MSVSVYAYWDYGCPFSYLLVHRLERIRTEEELDVRWRPLEIRPGVPDGGLPVKEAGFPPDRWAEITRHLLELARETGLELDPPSFLVNSRDALHAAVFAQDVGPESFRSLHRSLFRAYFVEGRNIGDRSVLLEVAEEAGTDPEALGAALDDRRYEDELRAARREAERYEITGTPTLLFHRHKVVGCAPMDVLRDAAERARGEAGESEAGRTGGVTTGPTSTGRG